MASAILRLAQDRELASRLCESAYQHINQFTWSRTAADLEMILLSELDQGPSYRAAKTTPKCWRQMESSYLISASKLTARFLAAAGKAKRTLPGYGDRQVS